MSNIRAIAFYLPQFHPIPENDAWWGKGFTEWANVAKAKALFPNHYQPHFPADLGFYDLRLSEVREAQAEMAQKYGIHGFCYYHYWFNGRRVLERPFYDVISSGKPDFPFCLCWANENWTRVWDGGDKDILLEQKYSFSDDLEHIRSLIPIFKDPRYIKIDGKPLFLVYRTEILPDMARTAAIWQNEAKESGLPGLYLARVENFTKNVDPASIGFDAAVEFAPDASKAGPPLFRGRIESFLTRLSLFPAVFRDSTVYSYPAVIRGMLGKPMPDYTWFRCVSPMWDNSARRTAKAHIYIDASPREYKNWLMQVISQTLKRYSGDERIVFVNAWNEWAEGCHLEPDQKWGHAYLQATLEAIESNTAANQLDNGPIGGNGSGKESETSYVGSLKKIYWRFRARLSGFLSVLKIMLWHFKNS